MSEGKLNRRPNFFILGAPKCGTTSLVYWLREHPNVFISPWKEPRFFDRDLSTRFRISEAEYLALFKNATSEHTTIGESTVWYLYSEQAAKNIEQACPGSKYVVLVRNPARMAYALHEQMTLHQAEHVLDFEKAWELSPVRRKGEGVRKWFISEPRLLDYQSVCRVGEQLNRLFMTVPRERVLVLFLDDFKTDSRKEYLKVIDFLGLSDDGRKEFGIRNSAKRVRWRQFQQLLVLAMKGERVLKGRLGMAPRNSNMFWRLNDLNKSSRPRPLLSIGLRKHLRDYYEDDIAMLGQLTARDLNKWLVV